MESESYQKLAKALQKGVKDRTSSDLITICSQIEGVNFLKQFIGTHTPEFLEMCQFLKLEEYPSEHILFKQGDEGDKYYIIVKGKVSISINMPIGKGRNQTFKMKEVGQIGVGTSFGELALLFNSIRNATITTLEDSAFIVLTKDIFSNYMRFKTPPNSEEILKFFDQQDYFQSQKLILPQKIQIVSKCDTKLYVSNAALILQGKPVESLNFIKKGLAKVYRKVKFKVNPLSGEIDQKSYQDPTEDDISNGYFKELFLEIDELYEGNLLCEYELLNFKNSQCSVLAYTPTEVISISRNDLSILPDKMIDLLKFKSKPYPPDSKLRKVFLQGLFWKSFKIDVLSNMNIESRNYKNICNQKILHRDQPYEIPHEALLHVEDDSFNMDLEENDYDLEKQVFKPLDKLFFENKKNNINTANQLQVIASLKESKLNDSTNSPMTMSKSKLSQQNFSSMLKSSPINKKNQKSQSMLSKKNNNNNNTEQIQKEENFLEYYDSSSLKLGSKAFLPPITQMNNSGQNRVSIVLSQNQIFPTTESKNSFNSIQLTEEDKKNLLLKELFQSLDPKKQAQNQYPYRNKQSNQKQTQQKNEPSIDFKKKEIKITLKRHLTPKINKKNTYRSQYEDVILSERAYKYN